MEKKYIEKHITEIANSLDLFQVIKADKVTCK